MVVDHSGTAPRGLAFATEQLDQLAFVADPDPAQDPVGHSHPISRAGLRQILLTGLEDVVAFDRRLVRYEQPADGQVIAVFADGSTARGDVLIGADGSSSAIRKQLLPDARVVDTGVAGIAGKLHLTDRTRERVPAELLSQMTMVLPPHGLGMFMAAFRPQAGRPQTPRLDLPEHLFWVLIGRADALGRVPEVAPRSPAELQQFVLHKVERWHGFLPWLVAESDPRSVVSVPLHTSLRVAAWPTTNVTLLGDAIHTMPPLQGLGGNTALRDAAVLCHHLIEADRGRADLLAALHSYESAMLEYGFEAVRRSVQVTDGVASTSTLGRFAFRSVLRAADRFPPLHGALFHRPPSDVPSLSADLVSASA
jgi:2-polyprenyl-6-methoxyphenol hydroxylase-like FAD-dependent oxidoreductase